MAKHKKFLFYSTPRSSDKSWVQKRIEDEVAQMEKAISDQKSLARLLGVNESLFKPLPRPNFGYRKIT